MKRKPSSEPAGRLNNTPKWEVSQTGIINWLGEDAVIERLLHLSAQIKHQE
jgi:hypothetical protein